MVIKQLDSFCPSVPQSLWCGFHPQGYFVLQMVVTVPVITSTQSRQQEGKIKKRPKKPHAQALKGAFPEVSQNNFHIYVIGHTWFQQKEGSVIFYLGTLLS